MNCSIHRSWALLLACLVAIGIACFVEQEVALAAEVSQSAEVSSPVVLTAQDTGSSLGSATSVYKIRYKLHGGKQAKGQVLSLQPGQKLSVSKLKKPTRTCYAFVGWYTDSSMTKKAKDVTGAASLAKRTLHAKWKLVAYKIVYKLNGGKQKSGYRKTVKIGKKLSVKKLKSPTRAGYSFAGWYKNKKLTKKASYVRGKSLRSKRTLYAKWTPIRYGIEYEPNGGIMPASYKNTYTITGGFDGLPVPERFGYSFIGWFADEQLSTSGDKLPEDAIGDRKLYAKWRKRVVVAHRGYCGDGAPQNSIDALRAAKERGFNFAETDVRFTSDNTPVLHHDATIRVYEKDEEGQVTDSSIVLEISSVTLDELQNDYVASAPSGELRGLSSQSGDGASDPSESPSGVGQRENVSLFSEYLDECKELGITPYIELKEGSDHQLDILIDMVNERGMMRNVRWISFTQGWLLYIAKRAPNSYFTCLGQSLAMEKKKKKKKVSSMGDDVVISLNASRLTSERLEKCKSIAQPLGVWTLLNEQAVHDYDQFVCDFTIDRLVAEKAPIAI